MKLPLSPGSDLSVPPNATLPACWCLISQTHYYWRGQKEGEGEKKGEYFRLVRVEEIKGGWGNRQTRKQKEKLFCSYHRHYNKKSNERRVEEQNKKDQLVSILKCYWNRGLIWTSRISVNERLQREDCKSDNPSAWTQRCQMRLLP